VPLKKYDNQPKHFLKECIWDIICNYLLGLITERFLADRVWSNFIIDKTADWMSDNICGAAMD